MPTYEYRCSACQHEFEQFQSMKDKPLRACPACKKPKLERLIGTGGAIIFKGSGFYQTDYRSEGYKSAAAADKPADASGPAASSTASAPAGASDATKTPPAPATSAAKPARKPPSKAEKTGGKKSRS